MKKLINSAETVVTDALAGMAAAHPSLSVDVENRVVTRATGPTAGKVGLVSGGGSGHEPLHAGYVGYGMLDGACAGEVFTSPVPDQIVIATTAASGGAGVLHVVKNYTGDVLNFQLAAELAADEGIEVASVVVNDDVAVQDSLYTAGRRGVGATVFVEKIAGALAERNAPLQVDDRDRVVVLVGHVEYLARGILREQLGIRTRGQRGYDLVGSYVDHFYRVVVSDGHKDEFLVLA